MRGGVLALLIVGCGYEPTHAMQGPSDGSRVTDSPGAGSDAPTATGDAKVYLDAPAGVQGMLLATSTTLGSSDLDLTAEGTLDWAHWGYMGTSGFDRKNGGTAISNLQATPAGSFGGSPFTASWSDGTPHANVSQTSSGVDVKQGANMTFTVAADTTVHTLRLYAGAQAATAKLDLSLSDGSATAISKTFTASGTTNSKVTITFNAASAGQTLTVKWSCTADTGSGSSFAALLEATLQ